MKRFFTILAIIALCASASAQTVKPLAYNLTNGTVMVSTNVTWSNSFKFSTNTVAAQVRTNLGLGATWLTNTNVTNFRSAINLNWSALTNSNVSTALLGTKTSQSGTTPTYYTTVEVVNYTNALMFTNSQILFGGISSTEQDSPPFGIDVAFYGNISINPFNVGGGESSPSFTATAPDGRVVIVAGEGLSFSNGSDAETRTNLGLGLSALTNTSNVTMMRALSGSTNTNTPYSGSVALTNTNVLVFSNGILQSVQ